NFVVSTAVVGFGFLNSKGAFAEPKQKFVLTENIKTPESAYFDTVTSKVFVSNVAGNPGEKDKVGWITEFTLDKTGHYQSRKLTEGLNAPKGLRSKGGMLYVSDIDELVQIEIATGKVIKKTPAPGATFLNDVVIADDGRIYASDMIASKIYAFDQDGAKVFMEGSELASPNGLLIHKGALIVASWGLITDPATFGVKIPGNLYSINLKTKKISNITKKPVGNLDGLELANDGNFIVSDWVAGSIFKINAKTGKSKILLEKLKNSADIGYQKGTLLVPEMSADRVVGYSL
ncbi:MAG: hypothetical protein NT027_02440, partial [Proteobacteria bacterium]|nr:hypothetical protein [Pseudomonadota bacterium]